jgi:TRIAD3 protein (E3 ubiquitin-protein ligase RNF216)
MTNIPTFQCCCCFDSDIELNQSLTCPDGHITCVDCITKAMQVAVGERTIIHCFHESGCKQHYTENALYRATSDIKLRKAYDLVVALKNISGSGLLNIFSCPFCDNVVQGQDNETGDIFYCNSCTKYSCLECKKERHEGSCNVSRRKEEEATMNFILKCYCNASLVRDDGCNKITCYNCRTNWCWICKSNLKGTHGMIYDHFSPAHQNQNEKCPLYGKRPDNQIFSEQEKNKPILRKTMQTYEYTPIVIGEPCRPPQQQPQPQPQPQIVQKRKRVKQQQRICQGVLKYNGHPCTKKSRFQGFCGFHRVK